eukprot:9719048-Lingulodinium_polyedra.AAC.1
MALQPAPVASFNANALFPCRISKPTPAKCCSKSFRPTRFVGGSAGSRSPFALNTRRRLSEFAFCSRNAW